MNDNISQTFNDIKDFTEIINEMEGLLKAHLPHVYRGTLRNCALVYTYLISKGGAYSKAFLKERLHLTEIRYVKACKLLSRAGFISNLNHSRACRYTRWTAVYNRDLEDEGLDRLWAGAQLIQNDTWNTFEKVCISNYSLSYRTVDYLETVTEDELNYHLSRVSTEEINTRHRILYNMNYLNRLKNIAIGLVYRRFHHKRGIPNSVRFANNSTKFETDLWKLYKRVYSNPENANPRDVIIGLIGALDDQLNPLYEQLNAYEEARA